jgi:hypothetical protein
MTIYPESSLLVGAAQPTVTMLALWHSLAKDVVGVDIEVGVANRHDLPQFDNIRDELNTAIPIRDKESRYLVLFFESLNQVKHVLVTHELGHWVLKLQGCETFKDGAQSNSPVQVLLNSMSTHPLLYELQRSIGENPQPEIDSRAWAFVQRFGAARERAVSIENALLFADDLINCSDGPRDSLIDVLERNHPQTGEVVLGILELARDFPPNQWETQAVFADKVASALRLGKMRRSSDVPSLQQMML